DDEVVLQCVACIQKENRKLCLAAEGLGNRLCYLEPTSEAKAAHSGGHKTLLYGHAILLRHSFSSMVRGRALYYQHNINRLSLA
uniref:Inositol 1,4,5-trisphosphate/ryanodine receptor domain-containing protein n=1 Tax=Periophthalmus magnuspinnatus TaxID=409849 RepID=A0A3B4AQB1_9GOBI